MDKSEQQALSNIHGSYSSNTKGSTTYVGRLLEVATAIFQHQEILNSYKPEQIEYRIEISKHIKDNNDSEFEIDVWVEIILSTRLSHIIIFECKNWKGKAGKPEVNNFKSKVRDVERLYPLPVKGVFVAKSATKDAIKACEANEDNVQMLIVDDFMSEDISFPQASYHKILDKRIKLVGLGKEPNKHYNLVDYVFEKDAWLVIDGKNTSFKTEYSKVIDSKEIDKYIKSQIDWTAESGIQEIICDVSTEFSNNATFESDDLNFTINKVSLRVTAKVFLFKSVFVSKFDFERKHRVIIQELRDENGQMVPFIFSAKM